LGRYSSKPFKDILAKTDNLIELGRVSPYNNIKEYQEL